MNRRLIIPTGIAGGGGYDWYVDGDIASSGNGKSLASAFKTIAEALAARGANQSVWVQPKDDGSAYRESLVNSDTGGFYSDGVYDWATDTWTGGAHIRAADIAPNASFALTGGLTNTYEIAVTVEAGASQFVQCVEDDVYLTRRASTALVDANAGSYYVTAETGNITLYIHASDSSDVTANGKVYEYSKRLRAVSVGNGGTISGLHASMALNDNGSFQAGSGTTIVNIFGEKGAKHILYQNPNGSSISNFKLLDANYTTSGTMFVYNSDTLAGNYTISNGTIGNSNTTGPTFANIGGLNGHNNVSGSLDAITMTNIRFVNLRNTITGCQHCTTVNITNLVETNCQSGVRPSSAAQTMNVLSGSWTSTLANQRAFDCIFDGTLTIASDFIINQNAATDTGMVAITSTAAVVLTCHAQFVQNITTGTRIGVYCSSPNANLTLTNQVFNSSGNLWGYQYYFHASATGTTWSSDNNTFESSTFGWYIFGTTHATFGDYQTAVAPNDANSTAS